MESELEPDSESDSESDSELEDRLDLFFFELMTWVVQILDDLLIYHSQKNELAPKNHKNLAKWINISNDSGVHVREWIDSLV